MIQQIQQIQQIQYVFEKTEVLCTDNGCEGTEKPSEGKVADAFESIKLGSLGTRCIERHERDTV
jgi:hypothetical protein